jgi:HK97 family phage portal protein
MPAGGLWFDVQLAGGLKRRLDADQFWSVPGPSLGGQEGISLIEYAQQSLQTSVAGDRAAAKTFNGGALISGLATPEDEGGLDADDVKLVKEQIFNATAGADNAGSIALVNRRLKFTPWTMTAVQAQFLESRQFQIEEISRWTGVPPHLLMQTDKQTSWGTGVDEQNRGLSKFVLGHWAQRFEQRASRLLAQPRWTEFDFAGLERPNFATVVGLVLQQIEKGLISPAYGRELLNIPESAAPKPEPAPDPAPNPDPNGGGENDPPAE